MVPRGIRHSFARVAECMRASPEPGSRRSSLRMPTSSGTRWAGDCADARLGVSRPHQATRARRAWGTPREITSLLRLASIPFVVERFDQPFPADHAGALAELVDGLEVTILDG